VNIKNINIKNHSVDQRPDIRFKKFQVNHHKNIEVIQKKFV